MLFRVNVAAPGPVALPSPIRDVIPLADGIALSVVPLKKRPEPRVISETFPGLPVGLPSNVSALACWILAYVTTFAPRPAVETVPNPMVDPLSRRTAPLAAVATMSAQLPVVLTARPGIERAIHLLQERVRSHRSRREPRLCSR